MKMGTIVKLPGGRIGTVVFNGLSGVGIKWGEHYPNPADFEGSTGDCFPCSDEVAERLSQWEPDAMLRDPWPGADLECVGEEYEIVRQGVSL